MSDEWDTANPEEYVVDLALSSHTIEMNKELGESAFIWLIDIVDSAHCRLNGDEVGFRGSTAPIWIVGYVRPYISFANNKNVCGVLFTVNNESAKNF